MNDLSIVQLTAAKRVIIFKLPTTYNYIYEG